MKKIILLAALISLCGCSALQKTEQIPEENLVEAQIEDIAQPTKKVVTVTTAGDFTLATDVNAPEDNRFVDVAKAQDDYTYFLKNVADIFKEDDLTIINFEGTLSDRGTRQDKQFAFRGKPEYVEILTSSGVEDGKIYLTQTCGASLNPIVSSSSSYHFILGFSISNPLRI